MILSTIYLSNMSQRMRLLPEMLTGTLLSASDSTSFPPVFRLGFFWVLQGRSDRTTQMWMMPGGNRHYQGLEGYVRRCSFLYMSGVNECERSIHQRPLIWHKHIQWIVDTSQVWSGNWSQLNKYIYIYIIIYIYNNIYICIYIYISPSHLHSILKSLRSMPPTFD